MKVAILQYPVVWADIEANMCAWEQRLRALKGQAEVALLPEMCTTGFCTDRPELAEEENGPTIQRLQAMAEETGMMVVGSYICRANENENSNLNPKIVNRGFLLRPGMKPVYIDKRHLYQHEKAFFSPGQEKTVVEWHGVKFRYIICYDLRFPVWDRQDKSTLYDILLVSANWPESRIIDWDVLIAARGTENQAYIAGCNIVGDDGLGFHYNGHSIAYDSRHQALIRPKDNESGSFVAEFNMEELWHYREKIPLWNDAD